jgi:hypothetical protein
LQLALALALAFVLIIPNSNRLGIPDPVIPERVATRLMRHAAPFMAHTHAHAPCTLHRGFPFSSGLQPQGPPPPASWTPEPLRAGWAVASGHSCSYIRRVSAFCIRKAGHHMPRAPRGARTHRTPTEVTGGCKPTVDPLFPTDRFILFCFQLYGALYRLTAPSSHPAPQNSRGHRWLGLERFLLLGLDLSATERIFELFVSLLLQQLSIL